ncbi:MAG: hypothetical protein Q7S92_06170 [Candidatus Diapherotrites archaeon]|nr:hypothetical protein [Candidatus Diapherotrites archaeon]
MVNKFAMYPDENPGNIPSEIIQLHLVRPVKVDLLEKVLARCPRIESITMSTSTKKRLAEDVEKLIRTKGITLKLEQNRGRAIEIGLDKMLQAIELRKDYRTLRDIEKVTGIPKSTIHYLVRYAKRNKIKKGKEIVYLK